MSSWPSAKITYATSNRMGGRELMRRDDSIVWGESKCKCAWKG